MANRACPNCGEIIPADVDYCPFCGKSTREGMDFDAPMHDDPAHLPEDLSVAVSNAQHKQCPNCREVIPADVDYCPFCGLSANEVVRQEPIPDSQMGGRAPAAPITNKAYVCLMCHTELATNGDYCQACRDRLDQSPDEWDAKKAQSGKTLIVVGVLIAVIVIALLVIVMKHHG